MKKMTSKWKTILISAAVVGGLVGIITPLSIVAHNVIEQNSDFRIVKVSEIRGLIYVDKGSGEYEVTNSQVVKITFNHNIGTTTYVAPKAATFPELIEGKNLFILADGIVDDTEYADDPSDLSFLNSYMRAGDVLDTKGASIAIVYHLKLLDKFQTNNGQHNYWKYIAEADVSSITSNIENHIPEKSGR